MRTVWKQELQLTDRPQRFTMRGYEKVVSVGLSPATGALAVWFLADPESTYMDSRTFQVFGTNDCEIPEYAFYVGTVIMGMFVWHIFEVATPEEG